jgi:hypothetical protein
MKIRSNALGVLYADRQNLMGPCLLVLAAKARKNVKSCSGIAHAACSNRVQASFFCCPFLTCSLCLSNVAAEWCALVLCSPEAPCPNTAQRPTILTEVLYGFPQDLLANTGVIPQIYPRPLPSTSFGNNCSSSSNSTLYT